MRIPSHTKICGERWGERNDHNKDDNDGNE